MTSVGEIWTGLKADPEQDGRLNLYKKPGPHKVTFLVGESRGGEVLETHTAEELLFMTPSDKEDM